MAGDGLWLRLGPIVVPVRLPQGGPLFLHLLRQGGCRPGRQLQVWVGSPGVQPLDLLLKVNSFVRQRYDLPHVHLMHLEDGWYTFFKMDDWKNLISMQAQKTRKTLVFNICPQGVARQKRWRGCVSRRRCWSEVRVHKWKMGWEERHYIFCYDHHNHDGNVHEDDDHRTPSQPQEQWELSE